ncbi:MAG TPA: YdcH family protein [Alphaproteobacteria bacterium]|nr:YdcH family protein [Alphaproteobacteria bacterium]
MNIEERIDALKARHAALEDAIQQETCRPLPDTGRIHDLKRQKLRIKDEIAEMSRH